MVAQINQTQVSAIDFLQAILVQFGFSPFKMKKGEIIATLNNFLIEQYAAGRKVLLIVDEAQNLSLRVLEEIRLLSGVETTKEKVLRIILAGQPELNAKLDAPELVQLTQRVRLRFHLTALSQSETAGLHPAPPGSRRRGRSRDLRRGHVPADLPLHRRRAAARQHAVRHGDDGGLRRGPRHRHAATDIESAVGELQWVEFAARTQQQIRAATELALPRMRGADPALPALGRLLVATDGRTVQEIAADPGQGHRRPHHRQRPADRQPVRQPASLPDHDPRQLLRHRGSQQHQRHLRQVASACAATTSTTVTWC